MIRATELSKSYVGVRALDQLSFEGKAGEVLGFLGPNGAGKTTTMRILTGFLTPSSGRVEIRGIDLAVDPRAARRAIGYLPESVPLYPEMRVDEYLDYRARLKGVPRKARRAQIDRAVEQAGIGDERRRVIGQLSKGYRQRVGLADALAHQPPILILDEPTDGLDPNQRRAMLRLISELGREGRAVILSTHILSEVEAVCDRLLIVDRGRLVAEGRAAELARPGQHLRVVARGEGIAEALKAIEGVTAVEIESDGAFRVIAGSDVREAVAAAVTRIGQLRELRPADAGLAEVFARLTQKAGA